MEGILVVIYSILRKPYFIVYIQTLREYLPVKLSSQILYLMSQNL